MDRQAVIDALLGAVTRAEADAALTAANAYLAEHPTDLDLAGYTESAEMVRSAWELPLEDWPQADRDELLRSTGRM